MSQVLSRQRQWQIANPTKAKLLRKQTDVRKRYALLEAGYGMTHEEICEYIDGYEVRHGKVSNAEWWDIYEYLDWKYNNSAICRPTPT